MRSCYYLYILEAFGELYGVQTVNMMCILRRTRFVEGAINTNYHLSGEDLGEEEVRSLKSL